MTEKKEKKKKMPRSAQQETRVERRQKGDTKDTNAE